MNIKKIEHIGIAVANLEEAIKYYEEVLGLKNYAIEEVVDQKVKTAFFMVGETKIELLEATSPDSTIAKFIENKGAGVHHIAFAVENTDAALQELQEKGIRLIDEKSRKGAENLEIGFLHPKATLGVLTEICS
jgi:methylmalonyl-CoA/ethylmalonyl-CoA epimerase